MEETSEMDFEILEDLYKFYERNKDWITRYYKYASKFDTDKVERKILLSDLDGMLEDCTILILTANSIEQSILTHKLYKEINEEQKLCEISADGFIYQFATVRNVKIVHMHTSSTASFTDGGSADAVRSALKRFRPKLVVSLGVAFGIKPKKQHLGDVLLSSAIIPYDIFNKDTDGVITLRHDDKLYTHEALNAWDVLLRSPKFYLEDEEEGRRSLIEREIKFDWKFGTMLSGGSVLSNKNKKQSLLWAGQRLGDEKIIGGEMEGTGIYYECRKPNIPCIVIKGICDWGAEKNAWEKVINIVNQKCREEGTLLSNEYPTNDLIKDCVQAYAMDNATEALFRLLRFDSIFLENYAPSSKSSVQSDCSWIQKFAQVKQLFLLSEEKLFKIAIIYIPLFLLFTVINICINRGDIANIRGLRWAIHGLEFFAFVFVTVILLIKCKKELYPIDVSHIWINFNFDELDLEKNNVCITINDHRPIFHVVISWWLSSGKIRQGDKEIGNLKGNSSINFKALNDFTPETILQIGYELANGDQYVHLIYRKMFENDTLKEDKNIVYCERIFRTDGSKYSFIGMQNSIIKNVVPKM